MREIPLNLRPGLHSDTLVPATPARFINLPENWRPLAVLGSYILMTDTLAVAFLIDGKLAPKADIPAEPITATLAEFTLVVMTRRGPVLFSVDSSTLALSPIPVVGILPATVRAVSATPIKIDIPACDIDKVSDAAVQAIRNADAAVRAEGLFWQPVIAWVRASDRRGNTIATSEPRLVTAPDGTEFSGTVTFQSNDGTTTLADSLEIPAWQLDMAVDSRFSDNFPDTVIDLMVSPMLYRFDIARRCSVSSRRRADNDFSSAVTLAPSTMACGPRPGLAIRRYVTELIARHDFLCNPLCSSTIDFDASALRIASRQKIQPSSFSSAMLSAPHSFIAARSASSAGAILWADLEAMRTSPPGAEHFAASVSDTPWHAAVKVSFADGSSLVTASQGLTGAPSLFGPVLSYPAPDAVSIYIIIKVAGQSPRAGSFPLTPEPSRRRAVYVHPSVLPFLLPDSPTDFSVPPQSPANIPFPRLIAAAPAARPLDVLAISSMMSARTNALAEAGFGQSGWDFGRSRFYAFTSAGIRLLNVDLSRRAISTSLIDSRVVSSPAAVAAAQGGLAAIASGDIILISGTKTSRLPDVPDARALAWNHADRELWVIAPGSTTVLCFDNSYWQYEISDTFNPDKTLSPYLVDSLGFCRIASHPDSSASIKISLTSVVDFKKPVCGPAILSVDAIGRFSPMTVTVTRSCLGHQAPAPDLTLTVRGPVKSPVKRVFNLLPARQATIKLQATTPSSSQIKEISLHDRHSLPTIH